MVYEQAEKNDRLDAGDLCTFDGPGSCREDAEKGMKTGDHYAELADELRRSDDNQKSIASAALAISRCEDEDEICYILGEIAHKYNPGSIVAISLYDPEVDAIRFRYYFGIDGSLERVINLMGRDPRQMYYSPEEMTDADRLHRSSGKLELIADGIYELAMHKFPRIACVAVEKLLGIESVYSIGFGLDGMPYGGMIFFMRRGRTVQGQYILETLVCHAAEVIKHRHAETRLRESQRFQSTLISNLPGMVYRCCDDADWTLHYVSDGCIALTGYSSEDLVSSRRVTYEQIIHPEDRDYVRREIKKAMDLDMPFKITYRIRTAGGEERWVLEQGRKISPSGDASLLEGFIEDITERKRGEEELLLSRTNLARAESIAHVGHFEWDIANSSLRWSDESYRIYGFAPGSLALDGDLFTSLLHPDDRKRVIAVMKDAIYQKAPFSFDFRIVRRDGNIRHVHAECEIALDSGDRPVKLFGIQQDITERKQAEARVRASLAEKEVMLKEIHHRVKNNLQVISSLLNLQASTVEDLTARQMLQESQHRVRSIALVHEKIYGSEDLAIINFVEYTRHLTAYLQHSYCVVADRVRLKLEGDDVRLEATIAVPLGLILNELVSNCYKHAFPDGRTGTITVSLLRDPYRLIVADDGVGLPAGFNLEKPDSMGLELVTMLASQIKAEVVVDSSRGTKFTITFRRDR